MLRTSASATLLALLVLAGCGGTPPDPCPADACEARGKADVSTLEGDECRCDELLGEATCGAFDRTLIDTIETASRSCEVYRCTRDGEPGCETAPPAAELSVLRCGPEMTCNYDLQRGSVLLGCDEGATCAATLAKKVDSAAIHCSGATCGLSVLRSEQVAVVCTEQATCQAARLGEPFAGRLDGAVTCSGGADCRQLRMGGKTAALDCRGEDTRCSGSPLADQSLLQVTRSVAIHCADAADCGALAVREAEEVEVTCDGKANCSELGITNPHAVNVLCDGADCSDLTIDGGKQVTIACREGADCSGITVDDAGSVTVRCTAGANCAGSFFRGLSVRLLCRGADCDDSLVSGEDGLEVDCSGDAQCADIETIPAD